ncbi:maltose O-acetyltransferase [Striga asiatica]|uniref:Maltose O-acetyltransferase n=1 Tax=Striga asiatica TaxID=4170 RepID=A0A5A7RDD6_STRAF|nr:maltose O-acetyltransferase [Striga asiatica]
MVCVCVGDGGVAVASGGGVAEASGGIVVVAIGGGLHNEMTKVRNPRRFPTPSSSASSSIRLRRTAYLRRILSLVHQSTSFTPGLRCDFGSAIMFPSGATDVIDGGDLEIVILEKTVSQPSSSIHHSRTTSSSDSCPINHGHSREAASSNRRAARENQGARTTATPSPSGDVRSSLKPRDEPSPTSLHRRDFRERQT